MSALLSKDNCCSSFSDLTQFCALHVWQHLLAENCVVDVNLICAQTYDPGKSGSASKISDSLKMIADSLKIIKVAAVSSGFLCLQRIH